jgi:uncharacterized membrane protein YkvA (DUF1232 family)
MGKVRNWRRVFLASLALARGYAADRKKTEHLLSEAERKAQREKGMLGEFGEHLYEFLRLLRAWVQRRYRVVPWKTLTAVLAAVIYFVNPFDLLPDFLPLLGLTDDASVVAYVLAMVRGEMEKFRDWEQHNARYGVATFED